MTREEAIQLLCVEKSIIIEVDGNKGAEKMIQAYDMATEALRHDAIFEQIKWERAVALKTLEEHGIGLGQKAEHIIPSGDVMFTSEVVRCKDCKWYKKIVEKSKSGLCHYDLVARCLYDEDFCSHGERREE